MSLTLPTAYSNSSKLGNIQENWIVQLGFFNGDAQGSGDGGWDATLQADGTANLLNEALDDSETPVDVDDGTVFQVGDYIKVESEIMKVKSISTNTLTVDRGVMSTTAATHTNNTAIYWNNFTSISLADTTIDDVFYHGAITNKPSIRSSIDLANSTAKTGNISLSIANFQYKGDDFSAELFLGTRKYINRNVKIYSQLNGETTLANCLQIYQGRLIDISHDDSSVSLQLTEQRPWDFISIPNVKSPKGNYFPIVYGDFTVNTSTIASPDFCESKELYPTPIEQVENDDFIALQPLNSSSGKLHFYNKSADRFLPLDDVNSSSVALGDGYVNKTDIDLDRKYQLRPTAIIASDDYDDYDDNGTETIDTDDTSFSLLDFAIGDGTLSSVNRIWSKVTQVNANIPQVVHEIQEYKTGFTFEFTLDIEAIGVVGDTFSIQFAINDKTTGSYVAVKSYNYTGTFLATGQHDLTSTSIAVSGDQTSSNALISVAKATNLSNDFKSNIKGLSTDTISYQVSWAFAFTGNQGTTGRQFTAIDIDFKMYDTFIQPQLKIPIRDTDVAKHNSASESIAKIETLYSGSDGLTASWDSGAILHGHDAHRDLLIRFAGYTTTAPENWTALNNDRAIPTWKIRWWELDPVELKKVLEQLQYEFGFIFKFRADGTGSYVHILQTSELSAVQTFKKEDIANLKINNSSFSDLLTKMEINYEKHPAENRYLSSVTSSNSTARTDWNIQAKENIKEVNLDMNVGTPNASGQTDGNADFYSYYDNIFGDIKKIINCDIVNSAKGYNLETGDIVQFSNTAGDMPVDPFGDNWADYYMITNLNRSPGKVSITAREVG